MPTPAEIPEQPAALTPQWLSEALGWPVRAAEVQILGQGQGFLGDVVRLRLDCEDHDGAPESVIAKLPKAANRAMGEMLGVYEREVLFFRDLGESFPVRIPEIYFSHYDPDAGSARQRPLLRALDRLPRLLLPAVAALGRRVAAGKRRRYLVIMEDLARYRPGDQFAGADAESCARVLEQFAPAHAHFWERTEVIDRFWLLPMDIDANMRAGLYCKNLPQFRAEVGPALRRYVDWLGEHYAELARTLMSEAPTTLVHNDLRLDNVCFDGSRCAFIDWQLVRTGPAAYDVAYFLSGALHEDAPPAAEDDILRRYHAALGRPEYAFERFFRDYQRALLLCLAAVEPQADIAIDAGRGQEMMARWRHRLSRRLARVDPDSLLAAR